MRIRIARGFWTSRVGLTVLGLALAALLTAAGVYTYYWVHFSHLIDERLSGQVFGHTSHIFTAPEKIFVGEHLSPGNLAGYLINNGYSESDVPGSSGHFEATKTSIEIDPSESSYFDGQNAIRVDFSPSDISRIHLLSDNLSVSSAQIEPELLTNLFDDSREKRRVVRFEDLPQSLVHAVLAAEDKRFFEHGGFDPIRVMGAAIADLRRNKAGGSGMLEGASTIDMQVARSFFFSTKRVWRRKLAETMVALELDHRFSKERIFELYANEIYLGNRGSFAIRGFGEAAEAYFGTDVRDLDLAQSAFLAGIIRSPNRYTSAERHPERASDARDRVLKQMLDDGYITAAQEKSAQEELLEFVGGGATSSRSAPYFVDMVRDSLLDQFSQSDLSTQSYRIYTTLDPALQAAAEESVDAGMKILDDTLARRYAAEKRRHIAVVKPQVALIALDPKTGAILALVGGRNYGESQLDHVLARRQPGSSFKPFVYAAAFDNSIAGLQPIVTPETTVEDEPTTFTFDGKDYTPNNDEGEFYGTVSARDALTHSLNVATVKFAEMVGYERVKDFARGLGLDPDIEATPAMAIGSYVMTPLEVAAGYTIFANDGVRAEPRFLNEIVNTDDKVITRSTPQAHPVLDPRVSYLVTSVLEDVINHGTGYTVRQRGFTAPAAGKTGTSKDGWFAGYTSNLLCVVWVGYDDDRDLDLTGALSAAPVWAEFMKRAQALPAYQDMQPLPEPPGLVHAVICPESGDLATPSCPNTRDEVYIAGTEPTVFCPIHGTDKLSSTPVVGWLDHLFGKPASPPPPSSTAAAIEREKGLPSRPAGTPPAAVSPSPQLPGAAPAEPEKKKGILSKIFGGIFGSSKKPPANPKPNS
ncbi:MAG TPA: PBP1A family penicillin-binding protein [Candidatus Acidoferrales bacterium]|nr:PBP1A family penicillin-binding protein [Candidatus Acidoferrales bacterium]